MMSVRKQAKANSAGQNRSMAYEKPQKEITLSFHKASSRTQNLDSKRED